MNNNSYTTTAWFVIASLCDCDHVATTVMDAAIVADTTPSNSATEITATGEDWRALVTEAATALARRTGRRVSGTCTAVYIRDDTERQVLQNGLVEHVCRLAEQQSLFATAAFAQRNAGNNGCPPADGEADVLRQVQGRPTRHPPRTG